MGQIEIICPFGRNVYTIHFSTFSVVFSFDSAISSSVK